MRYVARYNSQAAVITPDQADAFKNNQAYSGYGIFDGRFGTTYVTLPAGSYYLASRSSVSGPNQAHFEIDTLGGLAADGYQFGGNFFDSVSDYLQAGGRETIPFNIQSGSRYFIFSCNLTGLDSFIIRASESNNFLSGGSFDSFTAYNRTQDNDDPYYEVKLPPGSYAVALRNPGSDKNPFTIHGDYYTPTNRSRGRFALPTRPRIGVTHPLAQR